MKHRVCVGQAHNLNEKVGGCRGFASRHTFPTILMGSKGAKIIDWGHEFESMLSDRDTVILMIGPFYSWNMGLLSRCRD